MNQVSHELTSIFIGRVHLLATILIWKIELDLLEEKENEPYRKKLKQRDIELERFLQNTSNDENQIVSAEVGTFIDSAVKGFRIFIETEKDSLFAVEKKKFNLTYNREKLQQKIDIDIFSNSTETERILQYLEKPDEII